MILTEYVFPDPWQIMMIVIVIMSGGRGVVINIGTMLKDGTIATDAVDVTLIAAVRTVVVVAALRQGVVLIRIVIDIIVVIIDTMTIIIGATMAVQDHRCHDHLVSVDSLVQRKDSLLKSGGKLLVACMFLRSSWLKFEKILSATRRLRSISVLRGMSFEKVLMESSTR